ncbi:hypothetical protein F2Q69_00016514 [Brassica cretica]|uniref:Uncharacterized protein n=1 Tax=Brassica cretica TaxID=69181 RepID=A0A8S9R636_BRACR|nr:hypothetical protein F2Q69_00016514 [Brassica cretica]
MDNSAIKETRNFGPALPVGLKIVSGEMLDPYLTSHVSREPIADLKSRRSQFTTSVRFQLTIGDPARSKLATIHTDHDPVTSATHLNSVPDAISFSSHSQLATRKARGTISKQSFRDSTSTFSSRSSSHWWSIQPIGG